MKTQLLRAGSILLDERMAVSLDLPTMVWFLRTTNPTNPPLISLFPPRLYVSSWLDSHLPCFSRTFIYPKAAPSTHHSLLFSSWTTQLDRAGEKSSTCPGFVQSREKGSQSHSSNRRPETARGVLFWEFHSGEPGILDFGTKKNFRTS